MDAPVTKELPALPASIQQKADQFHAACEEILDRYLRGFELDMNRHAVKHGAMDPTRAHNDITRILTRQMNSGELPANMVTGLLAEAIIRGIAKKREGKG